MDSKIGIGIVTCNRPSFFLKCIRSIPNKYNLAVINDGAPFEDIEKLQNEIPFHYIFNKQNIGVGKSKNKLFRYFLEKKCDHIFIIEDDIVVTNSDVFNEYIRARNITGIQHFLFGYHGPANKNNISGGPAVPKHVIDYGNIKIALNTHSVGAFCYYSREVLQKVGLIDEEYCNAFEHVDHDYRIAKAGYCTPYWNWPDIANSMDYLTEIECSENSSSIRPRHDWKDNIIKGAQIFSKKHKYMPAWQNSVPDTTLDQIKQILKTIHKKYSNP